MSDKPHSNSILSVPAVLKLNHVFEALAHPRRRYLLYTLQGDNELTLWELAERIVAWEKDVLLETVSEDEIERVYVSLYHSHVPKLVDDGIIEFSEATETITPGGNAEQVVSVLMNAGGAIDSQQELHAQGCQGEGHS